MPELKSIDLRTADEDLFRPHLDTEFRLRGEGGEFAVTLLEVAEYPNHRGEDDRHQRKPFGLVFRCDQAVLPQGIYALSHPNLPPCELFLTPFEGGAGWCKLEAVFN